MPDLCSACFTVNVAFYFPEITKTMIKFSRKLILLDRDFEKKRMIFIEDNESTVCHVPN
jgi:hypothetical protein